MVKLVIGICKASSSLTLIASYSAVTEHPVVKEKEWGLSALSGETNIILFTAELPYASYFCAPVGLLEAPSRNISHPFWGPTSMTSSSGRSVASGESSGTGCLPKNQQGLAFYCLVWSILCWEPNCYFANYSLKVGRLRMYSIGFPLEINLVL